MNISRMIRWLHEKDPEKLADLFKKARACTLRHRGPKVYFRGIIELSNVCSKNCYYCGIRSGNRGVRRYRMSLEEILACAREAFEMNYGSVVLQSGERQDTAFIRAMEHVIREIKALSGGKLGITLSLGEQSPRTYERWLRAGAHRYLLRIETSDPALYKKLHPLSHSFKVRLQCLRVLRNLGYQTGTGVMIGLPGQSFESLAKDILFFQREDIDMIGMGPYVPHVNTPLAREGDPYDEDEHLRLGLVMIALTRLQLKDVNIAATTALQAIDPMGREKGVLAGANIIMPNITPRAYRENYQLYEGKPCLDEEPRECAACLASRIRNTGAEIGYGEWGDSSHFMKRNGIPQKKSGKNPL